jgi:hypothetical protein
MAAKKRKKAAKKAGKAFASKAKRKGTRRKVAKKAGKRKSGPGDYDF